MSKTQRIVFVLLVLVVSTIVGFRGIIRQNHARQCVRECVAALKTLENSPPGLARAEEFVRRLKSVDTTGVPEELKQALGSYTASMEASLVAARNGSDHKELDERTAVDQQRLVAALKKYR